MRAFRTRSRCFVDQYSQEIFIGGQVDGARTLSENIADNGGLLAAYSGFKAWSNKEGVHQRLVEKYT